jgi:hypothetical protein
MREDNFYEVNDRDQDKEIGWIFMLRSFLKVVGSQGA